MVSEKHTRLDQIRARASEKKRRRSSSPWRPAPRRIVSEGGPGRRRSPGCRGRSVLREGRGLWRRAPWGCCLRSSWRALLVDDAARRRAPLPVTSSARRLRRSHR
jgi:hypothetical protein